MILEGSSALKLPVNFSTVQKKKAVYESTIYMSTMISEL